MSDEGFALALLAAAYAALLIITNLRARWARAGVCAVAALGTGAYVAWRWLTADLGFAAADPGQHLFTIGCVGFETLLIAEFWIFLLLSSRTRNRSAEADRYEAELRAATADLPAVDVFIATYNEGFEVLEKSIVGALHLDYPNFRVHVLDDGHRGWLREFCERVGVHYIARPDNADKKAGNHNHALAQTNAPFVAVFDADFVPYRNFLWRTLGFFADSEVGIVQTPQAFFNKDSFQNNLLLQKVLPDEQRFFFNHIMPCRDAWDVAFYCGSAAVLRRAAVEAIGGIVRGMATEDQATSVAMLSAGYRTAYLNEQLSWGLAAESTWAFLEQRKRWCRGGVQLLYRRDGPLGPAMRRWTERLFFLPIHWLVGFVSPFYFIAIALLPWFSPLSPFFGIPPDSSFPATFLVTLIFSHALLWLGRGTWLPILSPSFSLFQACQLAPIAVTTLLKPFGPPLLSFVDVTPKGAHSANGQVNWRVLVPLLSMFLLMVVGILNTVFLEGFTRDLGEVFTNAVWAVFFAAHLAVAGVVAMELPYRRGEERFEISVPGRLFLEDGVEEACRIADLSLTGARLDHGVAARTCRIQLEDEMFDAEVVWSTRGATAVSFVDVTEAQRQRLIARLYTHNQTPPFVMQYWRLLDRTLRRLVYP